MFMPYKLTTKYYWLLVLLAGLTVSIVLLSFYLVGQLMEANWWVNHTLAIQTEAQLAMVSLLDCETASHGYLATGDPRFLEPYKDSRQRVYKHLSELKKLTVDNPKQRTILPRLYSLAGKQMQFCQLIIYTRKIDPHFPNHVTISLYPGKKIMDELRVTNKQIVGEEQMLLSQRQLAVQRLRIYVYAAILLMTSCSILTLIWIVRISRAYQQTQAKAQSEISTARDEAIMANELKSQFVANISHEVRTPMSGMLGLIELLKKDKNLSAAGRAIAGKAYTAGQDLLAILNDLLDFSKLESNRMLISSEPFSITTVLDEVFALIAPQAKQNGIELGLSFDEKIHDSVLGDKQKLKQVLLNLSQNAVKFTSQGKVVLSIELLEQLDQKMNVKFSISDTGIGISQNAQTKIFQPFVQADGSMQRQFGGTGLGLAICKRLVQLMSGTIGCRSVEGAGSTFWFTLPLVVSDSATSNCSTDIVANYAAIHQDASLQESSSPSLGYPSPTTENAHD